MVVVERALLLQTNYTIIQRAGAYVVRPTVRAMVVSSLLGQAQSGGEVVPLTEVGTADDSPTVRTQRDELRLAQSLADVSAALAQLRESAHVRELHAQIGSYTRVMQLWPSVHPSEAQRSAMSELVANLRENASCAVSDVDRARPPPSSTRSQIAPGPLFLPQDGAPRTRAILASKELP